MAVIGKAEQQDLPTIRKLAISIFTATYETHNNPEDFKAYVNEAFSDRKIESELLGQYAQMDWLMRKRVGGQII